MKRTILLSMVMALSACACASTPKPFSRHYYPARARCPDLAVLPNPATDADKDAWITDTTDKYAKCAAARRVFVPKENP